MKTYLTYYHPRFIVSLVYMLQASEYDLGEYLAWFWRAQDLRRVANRKKLVLTPKARLLLGVAAIIMVAIMLLVISGLLLALSTHQISLLLITLGFVLLAPFLIVYLLIVPLWLGELLIQKPRAHAMITRAATAIEDHPGFRIAIAGSYGKTTFKEALATIISAGRQVAATPGNMNTPLGISRFVAKLTGKEDILIFELGEYYPGDIKQLCELTKPNLGIITGINEAHLDKFKTLERTTATIFELGDFLGKQPLYKNGDNKLVRANTVASDPLVYTSTGVGSWLVSDTKVAINGTSFTAKNGRKIVHAKTELLGMQQVGPLVACIDIADSLGMSVAEITAGIAQTRPFEHRMQPRQIGGAWVIDDTYNGNSDGVRSGLTFLKSIVATRRIYVTPGLVEQGSRTKTVHEEIGRLAAGIADVVVLIKNSATVHIQRGLHESSFAGVINIVDNPVHFYSNLDQFVVGGDVVLMQNDWTDNYS